MIIRRRDFAGMLGLSVTTLALGGCVDLAEETSDSAAAVPRPPDLIPTSLEMRSWRLLNRFGFGPRPHDIAALERSGPAAFLECQLHPEQLSEDPHLTQMLASLSTLELDADAARDSEGEWKGDDYIIPLFSKLLQFRLPYGDTTPGAVSRELQQARLLRAVYSHRQVFESMVEFWTDHFSIDQRKSSCRWLKTVDDRQIRRHALGKFRDLLAVSMRSPAMLVYLDNADSRRRDPLTGAAPNENYARELLELHTLGVDAGYSLSDIQEVARCLTGWSVQTGLLEFEPGDFVFRDGWHDDQPKRVLGFAFPEGQAEDDGEELLNLLAGHPKTAEFISRKLCRRFVADIPPQALVDQLTSVFLATDGDIPSLIRTIVGSDEFVDPENMKLRRPFDFVAAALRATNAVTSGVGVLPYLAELGQVPFQWAQPDGYPDQMETWSRGMLPRWNFAIDLLHGRIAETHTDGRALSHMTGRENAAGICRTLARSVTGQQFPADILSEMSEWAAGGKAATAAPQWLALILSSPQFQWR